MNAFAQAGRRALTTLEARSQRAMAALRVPASPLAAPPVALCRVLLLAMALLFIARNLPWHLDDFDQAKQAFTSFEMVEDGHWWFQHTPTGRVATKPPLAGWISASLYFGMGSQWWQGAWRMPSLLSAALICGLLWKKGARLSGNTLGALAATAAFGFTVFTPRIASLVRTDMLLTACIVLAGCIVLEKVRSAQPWTASERWSVFGCVLASMMIKGPIAFAFLLPGLAAYAFLCRRWRLENNSWSGSWSWFAPLLFFAAWAAFGIWLSPEFYDQVVQKEFLGRFSTGENAVHQPRNPFFYIGLIALRWQPWSLILIGMACVKPIQAAFRRDPELLWLTCWSLGGLLLMSAVPSKRFDRILPVIPPLCLLLVAMARHLMPWHMMRKPALAAVFVALVISTTYAALDVLTNILTHQGALVRFGQTVRATIGPDSLSRLEVISGKDEGMLLYTGKTAFSRPDDALEKWNAGLIDYLVLPEKTLQSQHDNLGAFDNLAQIGLIKHKGSAYSLIRRRGDR